jgi:hypothetical protein
MENFLARWTSKTHKKTAGGAGGLDESGRFIQVRSRLSTAGGA